MLGYSQNSHAVIIYCHFVNAVISPTLEERTRFTFKCQSFSWNKSVCTYSSHITPVSPSANTQRCLIHQHYNSLMLYFRGLPNPQCSRIFNIYSYRLCARKCGHSVSQQTWLLKSILVLKSSPETACEMKSIMNSHVYLIQSDFETDLAMLSC